VPPTLVWSSADSVTILVRGVGTHGAYPHMGVDTVLVAAQIVVSLQSMVGCDINPVEGAVISVGSIHGGVKSNIIPDGVELQLTVRANTPDVRTRLLDGVDRVSRGTALALGVPQDRLPIVTRSATETTPPTIDDSGAASAVREAVAAAMGKERLIEMPPGGMGAEDFAYFVTPESGVRGVYFNVGCTSFGAPRHRRRSPHASVPNRARAGRDHRRRGDGRRGGSIAAPTSAMTRCTVTGTGPDKPRSVDLSNCHQRMESRHAMALSKMAGDLSVGTIGRTVKLKNADHGAVASRIASAEFDSIMAMPPLLSA
jgi:hypothetical protein